MSEVLHISTESPDLEFSERKMCCEFSEMYLDA